jgi:hypothetical protein
MAVLQRDGNNSRFKNPNLNAAVMRLCQQQGANWLFRFEEYATAATRIRAALPLAVSIDNLLHTHRGDHMMVQVGKLAIATVILEKEKGSYLNSVPDRLRGQVRYAATDTPAFAQSWYLPLMRLLVTGKTLDEVKGIFDNVAFVVFNYDRCLEHFLVNGLMTYFNISDGEAIDAVNRLTIIHPYGQVGHFGWQRDAEVLADFGVAEGDLTKIAGQILTFTESAREGVTAKVRSLVSNSDTLIFMGFGYLPQNMDMLRGTEASDTRRVFATMMGIGERDVSVAESEIADVLKRKIWRQGLLEGPYDPPFFRTYIERGSCRDLMDHHWLRLTRR